jgi:hypothetical protein
MKKPNKVKIGNYNYKIEYKEIVLDDDDTRLAGQIRYSEQLILIAENRESERVKASIIHECLHGIAESRNEEIKEKQIAQMTEGLFQFIKDNKDLIKYLMEG